MSGFEKSSSFKPEARSMARAPARLAPPMRAWLRNFGNGSLTIPVLSGFSKQNQKGHHPVWMMARISRKVVPTPSPGLICNSNDLGNSYDAIYKRNQNRSAAWFGRHGAASHRFKMRAGAVGSAVRHVR